MATFGTFVDGVSLKADELNDCFRLSSALPVVRQSATMALASTSKAFTFQVNKLVIFSCFLQIGASTGSTGVIMEVDLPVTAASSSVRVIGSGRFQDNSANDATLIRVVQVSTTRMAFLTETTTSLTTFLGQTGGPNTPLGQNDVLSLFIMYEAA
jgi:FAD/FMN-containing dehydrogenase